MRYLAPARLSGWGLRHEIAGELVRLRDGRREADGRELRRDPEQAGEAEGQEIAALRRDQRMQLVKHDPAQRREQIPPVGAGKQKRELLRRRQQDVGRMVALAGALRRRRIAGAGLDADR